MLKIFTPLALLLVLGSTVTIARAQSHSGTDAEQRACSRDVTRFCRKVIDQGDFTILACLKENRPKLTKACNEVLLSHGQ
ncbi:MAG: hypothetical protein JSS22_01275 [Proteobacteria bacterium]|nr:hypothetical protein [Pseudomonadota bacterium]